MQDDGFSLPSSNSSYDVKGNLFSPEFWGTHVAIVFLMQDGGFISPFSDPLCNGMGNQFAPELLCNSP